MTIDDITDLWARFAETHLSGKTINLACRGGDGYDLNAVIDGIVPILGFGILLKIRNATIISQAEREKDLWKEPDEIPEATFILLEFDKHVPEFRERSIMLPVGGCCVNKTGEIQFGGCTCFGAIYL